jgi:phosphopantothenoylcysteine decarboxylase/phosphopantothenate--cysteine ligase
MAEPQEILDAARALFRRDLHEHRVLVTAGPTVEDLDPVRFLSNRSTGRMGYAIALAAARRGADVVLVSGPTALPCPAGVQRVDVRSALEMERAVNEEAGACNAVIMSAAVADYRPEQVMEHKIKKEHEGDTSVLQLVKNPDILAGLAARFAKKSRPVLVGFALETQNVIESARAKLRRKGAHIIVANLAADGLGGDDTRATIVDDQERTFDTGSLTKIALADRILDHVIDYWDRP